MRKRVSSKERINRHKEAMTNEGVTTNGIPLNVKRTKVESNVHCELYRKLKNDSIEVYSEYQIGRVRCDLVVVKDGFIKGAIEVKRKKRNLINKKSKQYINYNNMGIPVVYCVGENKIENTISIVKKDMLINDIIPNIKEA